jgi:hypothetical protein
MYATLNVTTAAAGEHLASAGSGQKAVERITDTAHLAETPRSKSVGLHGALLVHDP